MLWPTQALALATIQLNPSNGESAPPTELEMEKREEHEAALKANEMAESILLIQRSGETLPVLVQGLLQEERRNKKYALLRLNSYNGNLGRRLPLLFLFPTPSKSSECKDFGSPLSALPAGAQGSWAGPSDTRAPLVGFCDACTTCAVSVCAL